jgi:large subunit ribosomal protein L4
VKLTVYDKKNKKLEDLDVKKEIFSSEVNIGLMHQVVTAQLAEIRSGTASTKTRKDVKASTAKPFRQKGTGRARQGTAKSPLLVGGGTVFGPHPRSYKQKINKKMFKSALRSALSDRVKSGNLFVVDDLKMEEIKTKNVVNILKSFKIEKCLIVDANNDNLFISARNLYGVKAIKYNQVNPYDILKYENLIITKQALKNIEESF